ncbi:glycoside hydrolase family 75 protein [Streptomyces sp. NPDC059805]|uniref:glycoside hydrolase family 75 protein n=1 Tax=Streptomyces sp. NPDC059805 TaxID=3346954 RepID=UPI00364D6E6C
MRSHALTLAAAGAALLAPTSPPTPPPPAPEEPTVSQVADVSAAELLAKVATCTQVSRGRYRTDSGRPAAVPVCGTKEAVFWKADMDIDCDGRPTARCSSSTDPHFSSATAFTQSDGRYLSAERLPYIVVPTPSAIWDYKAHGVRGGSLAAVVYQGRVRYAVVGDVGPSDIIGEASYAAAEALGIPADPRAGGAPSGVTYIVFKDEVVKPIEDAAEAVRAGERAARKFTRGQ